VILDHLNDMLTIQKNHDFSKHPSWWLCPFWLRIRIIWLEALIDEVTYLFWLE
jgi:hypothetical protein